MDKSDSQLSRLAASKIVRVVGILVVLAIVVLIAFFFATRSQAADSQPIAFNHQVMVGAGIQCLYCHDTAIKSPVAGIPSVEKCMGCHSYIATTNPEVQKVAAYYQRGEPIPWQRVNVLPRFVYFSHEVHVVVAGFNCERCHGDVSKMTIDQPVVRMNMGWCLSCHLSQPNAPQLRDCVVCHQ
jgi:hypothetical protein